MPTSSRRQYSYTTTMGYMMHANLYNLRTAGAARSTFYSLKSVCGAFSALYEKEGRAFEA